MLIQSIGELKLMNARHGGELVSTIVNRGIDLNDGTDRVVPFEAEVALAVTPRLDFPRRVEQGPVRARRVQQLAVSTDGRTAFSALGRIWLGGPDGAATRPRRSGRRSPCPPMRPTPSHGPPR